MTAEPPVGAVITDTGGQTWRHDQDGWRALPGFIGGTPDGTEEPGPAIKGALAWEAITRWESISTVETTARVAPADLADMWWTARWSATKPDAGARFAEHGPSWVLALVAEVQALRGTAAGAQ